MKVVKFTSLITVGLLVLGVVNAAEDHQHGHDKTLSQSHDAGHHDKGHDMGGMFLEKRTIDGYTVSFHVMAAKEGMGHGGSHNFMVNVEKDGVALNDVVLNSKVVHPNKKSESKALMKMGDWYMTGYDLGHAGRHQLMVLFKTSDGAKHRGGVFYPGKE